MWDLVMIWPGWELLDPIEEARRALAEAPEHDLLIFLANVSMELARRVAAAVPESDLFLLGHYHLFLEEPIWVGTVPLVQAGDHGRAVGLIKLTKEGLARYELIRAPVPQP